MAQSNNEELSISELESKFKALSVGELPRKSSEQNDNGNLYRVTSTTPGSDTQGSESPGTGANRPNAGKCQDQIAHDSLSESSELGACTGAAYDQKQSLSISPSGKYSESLPEKWKTKNGDINLGEIVLPKNLPEFIRQVGQPSTAYKELSEVYKRYATSTGGTKYSPPPGEAPYLYQCKGKFKSSKVELPPPEPQQGLEFRAYSLTPPDNAVNAERNIKYIDCDYILDIHVPMSNFKENKSFIDRLTDPSTYSNGNDKQRWIFIPSFLRANFGLFNWKLSGVHLQTTNQIIVVLPNQFDTYISRCGHELPILCLPQDVLGIGYARHWILKIAMRLGLEYIWMIDDSVSWFCKYSCLGEQMKDSKPHLSFELAFKEMEDIAQSDDRKEHLAAIGPSRWRGAYKTSNQFTDKPPQVAVYLNLKLIKDKHIQYRPELDKMEDMVFGAECMKQGLTVCRWNEMLVEDKRWHNTGADSPQFKRQPQTPQVKAPTLSDSKPSTPGFQRKPSKPPQDKATTSSDSKPSTPKSRGVQLKPSKSPQDKATTLSHSKPSTPKSRGIQRKPPQDKVTTLSDSKPSTPKSRGVQRKPSKSPQDKATTLSDSKPSTPKSRGVQHKPPQDKATTLSDSKPSTPKSRGVQRKPSKSPQDKATTLSDSKPSTPKSRGVQHKPPQDKATTLSDSKPSTPKSRGVQLKPSKPPQDKATTLSDSKPQRKPPQDKATTLSDSKPSTPKSRGVQLKPSKRI